jgi:hypothetical protein
MMDEYDYMMASKLLLETREMLLLSVFFSSSSASPSPYVD